jgi:hypothetical protein
MSKSGLQVHDFSRLRATKPAKSWQNSVLLTIQNGIVKIGINRFVCFELRCVTRGAANSCVEFRAISLDMKARAFRFATTHSTSINMTNKELKMNTFNVSKSIKLNAVFCALLLCGVAGAQNIELDQLTSDAPYAEKLSLTPLSPLLILSERVGDVGREAISIGIQKISDVNQFSKYKNGIVYVDVDSIKESSYRDVFNSVHATLGNGGSVVIETSDFNFEKMHKIVESEFPMLDRSTIEDVAVLLRPDAGTIKAMRIDPSELAMYAGADYQNTTAGQASLMLKTKGDSKALVPATSFLALYFAIAAYEENIANVGLVPDHWKRVLNRTVVDVWQEDDPSTSTVPCYVAWRGTDIRSGDDVWADLTSQFHVKIQIPIQEDVTLKAGKGFVKRFDAYKLAVNSKLTDSGCTHIYTTGHSLGAAVSQVHATNLAYDRAFKHKLRTVYGWNSPNVVDANARDKIRARLADLIVSIKIANRRNDAIVNSVPTGLKRLGNPQSLHIGEVDYVGPQKSLNPAGNHSPGFWLADMVD